VTGGEPPEEKGPARVSEALARELAPVRWIETDPEEDAPEPGLGLCLSGGGYRAMLFHAGSLWRLNELGCLPDLKRISSVSGGSITAGVLGAAWDDLGFGAGNVAGAFEEKVVGPVRDLADRTIDAPAIARGLLTPGSVADRLAGHYDSVLFHGRTLAELPGPPAPLFVINSTNVQSGVLWRFTRAYMWDYKVGKVPDTTTTKLAVAVAASSAFPPFLSPLDLRFAESDFEPGTGDELQRAPFTTRVVLTDGGVYDNLGLETVWKNYRTVLASDGGGTLAPEERPARSWPLHAVRTLFLVDSQVRALRKRKLIASYKLELPDGSRLRGGAYWGIRSDVADFGLEDPLLRPSDEAVRDLAGTETRLRRLDAARQERLINWGYLICDTAMRKHVAVGRPRPDGLPYPGAGI
jgi:NTE family protein